MANPVFNRAAAMAADRLGVVEHGWARVRVLRLHDVMATAGRAVAPHAHAWFELSVVAAGTVVYSSGGEQRRLRRGALFAMPPGRRHAWTSDGPALITGWQLLVAPAQAADRSMHERWLARVADRGWWRPTHPLARAMVDELHVLAAGGAAALPACCALMRAQLCWALDNFGLRMTAEPEVPTVHARIPRLREYLLEHLAEDLPLADLARRFGLGPRHLGRVFAAASGMPLHRFIAAERLDRAAHALRSSDATVAAIARRVGDERPDYPSWKVTIPYQVTLVYG